MISDEQKQLQKELLARERLPLSAEDQQALEEIREWEKNNPQKPLTKEETDAICSKWKGDDMVGSFQPVKSGPPAKIEK